MRFLLSYRKSIEISIGCWSHHDSFVAIGERFCKIGEEAGIEDAPLIPNAQDLEYLVPEIVGSDAPDD
jgi:hypothetical protein